MANTNMAFIPNLIIISFHNWACGILSTFEMSIKTAKNTPIINLGNPILLYSFFYIHDSTTLLMSSPPIANPNTSSGASGGSIEWSFPSVTMAILSDTCLNSANSLEVMMIVIPPSSLFNFTKVSSTSFFCPYIYSPSRLRYE